MICGGRESESESESESERETRNENELYATYATRGVNHKNQQSTINDKANSKQQSAINKRNMHSTSRGDQLRGLFLAFHAIRTRLEWFLLRTYVSSVPSTVRCSTRPDKGPSSSAVGMVALTSEQEPWLHPPKWLAAESQISVGILQ